MSNFFMRRHLINLIDIKKKAAKQFASGFFILSSTIDWAGFICQNIYLDTKLGGKRFTPRFDDNNRRLNRILM